ncbi:MAG: hypothetical protein RLZZ598_1896 [Pseudomonadota bacterium]|jgi:hypothetical protein
MIAKRATAIKQLGLGLNLSTKKTRKREFPEAWRCSDANSSAMHWVVRLLSLTQNLPNKAKRVRCMSI